MPIVRFWLNAFVTALAAFWLGMTIVSAAAADQPAASADAAAPNCLLPGQIRRFGSSTMVTPRRAVTLPAAECVARGGEPIARAAASG